MCKVKRSPLYNNICFNEKFAEYQHFLIDLRNFFFFSDPVLQYRTLSLTPCLKGSWAWLSKKSSPFSSPLILLNIIQNFYIALLYLEASSDPPVALPLL